MKQRLGLAGVCLALVVLSFQISRAEEAAEKGTVPFSPAQKSGQSPSPQLMASHEEAEQWADATLNSLSLERKVGQMICQEMRGEFAPEDDPKYQSLLRLIGDYGIGSLVLYGGTPQDTANRLNRLQKASPLPLLVSADFEGGPGQQFRGASEFPANMALSAIGSEALAYEVGKAGAIEGRAIGVHLTYSPVVDVQTQPNNPVLGVRSFGADLQLLGRMAGAYIRGYQDSGMLATAKHFPGRGEVRLIRGTEFTINPKSAEKVESEDFLAFRKAIDAGVAYVMSEHIAVPSVAGGSNLPACVEKALASDWLRGKLGFQGVLTTDDMWYEKIVKRFGAVEACVRAVEAGHDVILKPADAAATVQGLVAAVRSGRISQQRIDASVRKVLYWKARLNLHRNRLVDESRVAEVVGSRAHRSLVERIADQSLTLVKNDGFLPGSKARSVGNVVHVSIQRREADVGPAAVDAKLKIAFPKMKTFFVGPYTSTERMAEALKAAATADTVIVSLFYPQTAYKDNGQLSSRDQEFFDAIAGRKPRDSVAMCYGNPYVAACGRRAAAVAIGYGAGGFYGNQVVYADSLLKLLRGELRPQGKLPVAVSADFPRGSGLTY
jgi:beta-N-acetylhexosaminidase